jgi:CheY-like chemotaxis protein/anti-sigma regulatory factor (Ser/Thr protein kinase)
VLEHALALVRERAARHGLTVSLDVADDVGVVWADETKLKQVVLNLLTNAVKFTPAGGSVSVRAWLEGDKVHVSVRDTGVGIAASDQARIFEAFQRGDRRVSVEGTGLGLTLSKRFVELHGGRIWVSSAVGEGSEFGFAIPVGRSVADGADVLLIEDDRRSADLFQLYLEGAGYRVSVARDGTAGLHLARTLRPRAVVLDLLLPGTDGWDVLAQLSPEFPVIVVSMLDERPRGVQLGAAEYLVKPVSREDMLAALEVVL